MSCLLSHTKMACNNIEWPSSGLTPWFFSRIGCHEISQRMEWRIDRWLKEDRNIRSLHSAQWLAMIYRWTRHSEQRALTMYCLQLRYVYRTNSFKRSLYIQSFPIAMSSNRSSSSILPCSAWLFDSFIFPD